MQTTHNPALTLLLVDDSAMQLEFQKMLLADQGFQFHTASNGQEALEKAHQHEPDLILMDLEMPGMNGLEAAEALRKSPKTGGIPIIMVSASSEEEDMEQAFIGGCCEYINKPVHRADLLTKISGLTGYALTVTAND